MRLNGVLSTDYVSAGIDRQRLGELIDFTVASEGDKPHRSVDLLAPDQFRINDPARSPCGMSIQSDNFVGYHADPQKVRLLEKAV